MPLANAIATSIKSKLERFRKLYRILYRDFLFQDFVHKKDLIRMHQEIHTRITNLEAAINANMATTNANIAAAITGHIHAVPQSPGGTNPSGPGLGGTVTPPQPSAVPIVAWAEPEHTARLQQLIAEGPATAPLADGFDPQIAQANVEIIQDIGV